MPNDDSPMGEQFVIAGTMDGHVQYAVVNQVGAALRRLVVDGVELIQDYPPSIPAPSCAGVVLVPWPNRVAGGSWENNGVKEQLEITEPELGHAIHGLLRHTRYREEIHTGSGIKLAANISPAPGYPFELATSVEYQLTDTGLIVTHRLENIGTGTAPVAVGAHPFLRLGDIPVAELELVVNASIHHELNSAKIPTGQQTPVDGSADDYREGKILGERVLDDLFSGLLKGPNGGSKHCLRAIDGSAVELHMDSNFGFIQAYTTFTFPGPAGQVHAVALEPMSAPANAFNSGLGLHHLRPGQSWAGTWGIDLRSLAVE